MYEQIITLSGKIWIVWMSSTCNIIINGNKNGKIIDLKWVLFLMIPWKFGCFQQSTLVARCLKLAKLTTDSLSQIWLTLGLAGLDLNIWIDHMNMH